MPCGLSSLQLNIPITFCLVLIFWNLLQVIQLSLCIFWHHRFYVESVSWVGYMCKRQKHTVLEQKQKYFSSCILMTSRKKRRKEKRVRKKRKQFVIGSRIRERDKKNAEYYVGDYCLNRRVFLNGELFAELYTDIIETIYTLLQESIRMVSTRYNLKASFWGLLGLTLGT